MRRAWRAAVLGAGAAALWTGSAAAHDFWLQPDQYRTQPGAKDSVLIEVGHGPFRQRWNGSAERVAVFKSFGPGGTVDQHGGLRAGSTGAEDAVVTFPAAGEQILVFQTNYAVSNLPSIRYNDYAKVEGLTPALDLRAHNHQTDQPGREIYSRRAKALVLVGPPTGRPQPQVTRPIGLSLEIVPLRDPYALGPSDSLPVQVLYEGRPLAGALVKLTNLEFDARPLQTHLSDRDGRASFTFPRLGTWLINVIWTKPIHGDPRADFDTTFSSLTFAFPQK